VTPPTDAYCKKFLDRTLDLIDRYEPDLVYFDDTAVPFWPINDIGLQIAAHYYNGNLRRRGELEAVLFGKILDEQQRQCLVWDIERGQANDILPLPWQTDTCIGSWHYDRGIYEQGRYKTAETVVRMLVDIVSKNGNLLLSIPVRGNGTIDEKELQVLEGIEGWIKVNRNIFRTRPASLRKAGTQGAALSAQGFSEGGPAIHRRRHLRDPRRHAHATVSAPDSGRLVVKSLAEGSPDRGVIRSVRLLGHNGSLDWRRSGEGVSVQLPATRPADHAHVLEIKGLTLS
jgi:alpha-L-fucosidase